MRELLGFLKWAIYYFMLAGQDRLALRWRFGRIERRVNPQNKQYWIGDRRRQTDPIDFQSLPVRLIHLTLALMAVFAAGAVLTMMNDAYLGLAVTLAYSAIMAIYAVYSALRLRLSHE